MKKSYLSKSAMAGICLLAATGVHAQIVGTNAFLQGKFVELGVTEHGSYGTSTSPTSYHSHATSVPVSGGPLGFVADPDMDGWTVGTPAYMGDYFYPGTPFEGWEIQIDDTVHHQEFNMSPSTIGGNTAYDTTGSKINATWQGMIDSVLITQVTSIDTSSLYFTINVTLTNLGTTPKNNVYYLRSVDPDNDQSWPGGSFTTKNTIEHQSTDTTVVSALGMAYSIAYLGLGTTDTNSTAFTYGDWPLSDTMDLGRMYHQTYMDAGTVYTQGTSMTADISIGVVTYVPHLATVDSAADSVWRTTSSYYAKHAANSANFTYFYSFSPSATDSAIKTLHQLSPLTLGVGNVNNTAAVKVYPNPTKDMVNITGLNMTDQVTMYDMMGRAEGQNWTVSKTGTNTFHFGGIPAGAYILIITDANGNVKSRTPIRKM